MNAQLLNTTLTSYASAHPVLVVAITLWSIIWKLIALWKAAQKKHLTMFVVIGILNTAGALEICYLIWLHFRNKKKGNLPE
jgi:hypothetical protein